MRRPWCRAPATAALTAGTAVSGATLVTVSDPDGLSDIAFVEFADDTPGTDGGVFRIDGVEQPRPAAGPYRVQVAPDALDRLDYVPATPGENTIRVEAVDRAGNVSDPLLIDLTVTDGSGGGGGGGGGPGGGGESSLTLGDLVLTSLDGAIPAPVGGVSTLSGRVEIGRADGAGRMLRIDGQVEIDRAAQTASFSGATVTAILGPAPRELFTGAVTLDGAAPEEIALAGVSPSLALAGLPVGLTRMGLETDEIRLATDLPLPSEVIGAPLPVSLGGLEGGLGLSPDALIIDADGLSLGTKGFVRVPALEDVSLFGLLDLDSSALTLSFETAPPRLALQGAVTLEPFAGAPVGTFMADLAGENGIFVENGVADLVGEFSLDSITLPGGWGLEDLALSVDTVADTVGGDATVTFPFGGGVSAGLDFLTDPLALDRIDLALDLPRPLPIGTTSFFLSRLGGGLDNLAPAATEPVLFSGAVDVIVGAVKATSPLDATIDGDIDENGVSGDIDATLLEPISDTEIATLNGSADIDWSLGTFDIGARFSMFGGAISGGLDISADRDFNFAASGSATATIPSAVPGLGGTDLGSANFRVEFSNDGDYANDFGMAWIESEVDFLWYEETLVSGFKGSFDGNFELVGAEDIGPGGPSDVLIGPSAVLAEAAAQPTGPQASAGIALPAGLGAAVVTLGWDNAAGRDVALFVETPDGTRINEADFDANEIGVVPEFSDDTRQTLLINAPADGTWRVGVEDGTGLGALSATATRPGTAPSLALTGVTGPDANGIVEIDYQSATRTAWSILHSSATMTGPASTGFRSRRALPSRMVRAASAGTRPVWPRGSTRSMRAPSTGRAPRSLSMATARFGSIRPQPSGSIRPCRPLRRTPAKPLPPASPSAIPARRLPRM